MIKKVTYILAKIKPRISYTYPRTKLAIIEPNPNVHAAIMPILGHFHKGIKIIGATRYNCVSTDKYQDCEMH